MSETRNSILYSVARSFLSTLSAMAAVVIGLFMISGLFGDREFDSENLNLPNMKYAPMLQANANDKIEKLGRESPVMLKLNIDGAIGLESLNMHAFREQLLEANEGVLKGRVKGLLLHIDSPGGTVTDADGIYRAVKEFKEQYKVPVYAYVDGLCASGGMYIASAADKIFASDISLVGSVGVVVSPFFNVTELMKKLGIEAKTISAGLDKDDLNPFRIWTKDEDKALKTIVDYYYARFVDIVVAARPKLDKERLLKDYGARVFPAAIAKDLGFIDESGYSLNDAKKLLAKAMQVDDDKYQVVKLERQMSIADLFKDGSALMQGGITHKLELTPDLSPQLMNKFLYMYMPR